MKTERQVKKLAESNPDALGEKNVEILNRIGNTELVRKVQLAPLSPNKSAVTAGGSPAPAIGKRKLGSIAGYGTKSDLDNLVDDDFSLPSKVQHAETMKNVEPKKVQPLVSGNQDTEIQNLIDELEIDEDSDE